MDIAPALADEPCCYVTTEGRLSGKPHRIEIWFALREGTLYILAGGGKDSDWVKNIKRRPDVPVRVGPTAEFIGRGRIVEDAREDALARRLLLEKYSRAGHTDLDDWARTALPVAIDLSLGSATTPDGEGVGP
jgi:deazaflavin-dependent oxidoreductase (nitroreductase family)